MAGILQKFIRGAASSGAQSFDRKAQADIIARRDQRLEEIRQRAAQGEQVFRTQERKAEQEFQSQLVDTKHQQDKELVDHKAKLPGGGADPTSSMRDYDKYQRLLREDPDQAEVFGRQAGFVSKEGQKLSAHMEKRLSAANDEAVQSAAAARSYEGLAQDFLDAGAPGGVRGRWSETFKEFMGSEDAVSEFRQQYRQIRNTEAVKNLPPGVASDKDIELALSGFPKDTANPEYVARFMRGMSKLAQHRADYADFKARYISDRGSERGFLEAWRAQFEERDSQEKGVTDLSDDELLSF